MNPFVNPIVTPYQIPNQKKIGCNNSTNLTLTIWLQPYLRVGHIFFSFQVDVVVEAGEDIHIHIHIHIHIQQ